MLTFFHGAPRAHAALPQQAKNVGTIIVEDHVNELNLKIKPFTLKTESRKLYSADSIIISTGAQAKWMGLPSEEKFRGFGVSDYLASHADKL